MTQRIIQYYVVRTGIASPGEPELRNIAALAGAAIEYPPIDVQKVFAERGTTRPPGKPHARRDPPDKPVRHR